MHVRHTSVDVTAQEFTVRKVGLVSNYLPRKCGVAVFAHALTGAFTTRFATSQIVVAAVTDKPDAYDFPQEVSCEFDAQDPVSYLRTADYLNLAHLDVVCLQHEYGIYGGAHGQLIINLLRELKTPIVTVLHTILRAPSVEQRKILKNVVSLSDRVVTMTDKGRDLLQEIYEVEADKIDVIPRGFFAPSLHDLEEFATRNGLKGKRVLMSSGLLSPNKGIEYMIRAMPAILRQCPNTVYVVVGQTHPNVLRDSGETYRISLEWLARDMSLQRNVKFINQFVEDTDLAAYLAACDVYVTPYLSEEQISSGTLSQAIGSGCAVVSTPYWHASEILADGVGRIVPFRDSTALSDTITALLLDPPSLLSMRAKARTVSQNMEWPQVAEEFQHAFQMAGRRKVLLASQRSRSSFSLPSLSAYLKEKPFPEIKLDHMLRLTDSTGMIQHCIYSVPDFSHGYDIDDTVRAAIILQKLSMQGHPFNPQMEAAMTAYIAFISYAFNREKRRFRNFMSYDRKWLDPQGVGSEDSHGRTMYCLGLISRSSPLYSDQAKLLFDEAMTHVPEFTAARCWAYILIGLYHYRERFPGDRLARDLQETLASRLMDLFAKNSDSEWVWFEDHLTYCNAVLPRALFCVAVQCESKEMADVAGALALVALRGADLSRGERVVLADRVQRILLPREGACQL